MSSPEKFDVIHSMEVLYYLEDPALTVKKITDSWLHNEGRLIAGVDLYYENQRISFLGRKSRYQDDDAQRSRMD